MNFTKISIAALLLVNTASQAAPDTITIRLPRFTTAKKYALASLYAGLSVGAGFAAAGHVLWNTQPLSNIKSRFALNNPKQIGLNLEHPIVCLSATARDAANFSLPATYATFFAYVSYYFHQKAKATLKS